MHKLIYSIGIFVFLLVLSSAFYSSYQVNTLKAEVQDLKSQNEALSQADTATADQGYYLLEKDGYVCVYKSDQITLYESTSIKMDSLPDKLREEIESGKYLESELKLYSFLENYSS